MLSTMVKVVVICLLIYATGCSLGIDKSIKRRKIHEYTIGGGYAKYILYNTIDKKYKSKFNSTFDKCTDKTGMRIIKIDTLRKHLSLSYSEALSFQYSYNIYHRELLNKYHIDHLSIKQEDALFYSTVNKIKSGIEIFKRPKYKRIHIILIEEDDGDSDKQIYNKIKKLMSSNSMSKGHPIFISPCMHRDKLERFASKYFGHLNIKIMSREIFSPYDEYNNLTPNTHINLSAIFKEKQKLYLYSPRSHPPEINGNFELVEYR